VKSQRAEGGGVTDLSDVPPRISTLGNQAVGEIARRCGVPKATVMRAMLLTALHNQSELMRTIESLRGEEIPDAAS
jgi:hypothetical protein